MIRTTRTCRCAIVVLTITVTACFVAPLAAQEPRADVTLTPDVMRDLERVITAGAERARVTSQGRDFRIERVDRISRTISIGATGLLELRNVSGDVTVTAAPGRDAVVEIVRRSRGRTESDAALGLQEVQVNVDHRGERATVEAVYPTARGRRPYDVSTTYTVTAPPGTRVTARSISGSLTLRGITGDVSAETVSGGVTIGNAGRVTQARSISGEIRLSDITTDGTTAAGTVSGNVELLRVRARRVTADTVSGNVRAVDVTCDGTLLKSLSGSVEFDGPLARSGRYELETHSGSVRFVAGGAVGFELQARSFSGRIRPEGLTLQTTGMDRGELRATVGDGSAVVIAKTFSGDVIVSRK
jgi:hypothetical protein